jgi:hypothetical protein
MTLRQKKYKIKKLAIFPQKIIRTHKNDSELIMIHKIY